MSAASTSKALTGFPRVEAYLRTLPHGIHSYPKCLSKASIQRPLLERFPVDLDRGPLPGPAVSFIEDPPLPNAWVPTVVGNVVELAVADAHCDADSEFAELARQMNLELLASPMYRILVYVMSPGFLLKQARNTWKRFHKGTPLHAIFEGKSARLTLRFPQALHPPLVLLEKAMAFQAALEAAGAKDAKVQLLESTPERADYAARWA